MGHIKVLGGPHVARRPHVVRGPLVALAWFRFKLVCLVFLNKFMKKNPCSEENLLEETFPCFYNN